MLWINDPDNTADNTSPFSKLYKEDDQVKFELHKIEFINETEEPTTKIDSYFSTSVILILSIEAIEAVRTKKKKRECD